MDLLFYTFIVKRVWFLSVKDSVSKFDSVANVDGLTRVRYREVKVDFKDSIYLLPKEIWLIWGINKVKYYIWYLVTYSFILQVINFCVTFSHIVVEFYSVGVKTRLGQTNTLCEGCFLTRVVGFCQKWCRASWSNISTLLLSVQTTPLHKFCVFRCICANLSCAAMFLFRQRSFSPAVLPNKSYLSVLQIA